MKNKIEVYSKKIVRRIVGVYYELLKIDFLRNGYCRFRYFLLKGRVRISEAYGESVGAYTIKHNMDALNEAAAFGMGNRMALLIYPIAAMLRNRKDAKVLIVGPRTEDDIFWARSLGLRNTRGFDLFTYSVHIDIGDIHKTSFEDGYFDAVILGWVISYSCNPEIMVDECKRIVKPGGYIAFGVESNPEHRNSGSFKPPRVNSINSGKDIVAIARMPIVFIHDPEEEKSSDNAVIFQTTVVGGYN